MSHNNSCKLPGLVTIALCSLLVGCSKQKELGMSLNGNWLFKIDSTNNGVSEKWYEEGFDRSGWMKVNVPDYWDRYNLESYDGVGWYANTFDHWDSSKPMALFFGGVDDDTDVWINGQKVGSHTGYSEPFYFEVTKGLRPGKNEIVVRVNDYSGPGGIYKPVILIQLDRIDELLRSKYADLPARPSADWVRDAVIYEIYLRSFSKEGTIKALEKRVPELKQLGVTVLWLMPIHPVGELNRKGSLGSPYAVQDYYAVNPDFGTLEDFQSLVKIVHENGMKIIIDLVINHAAWDSKLLFEHPEWFTHNEEGAIVSPNADWSDVADLNYDHHELRKWMIEMMKYWVRDIGIDGYRCDVAELVPTDFWERARRVLDKIKPIMMLSEGTIPEHHVAAFDLTYSWNVYDVFAKVINGSTPVTIFDRILKTESLQFPKGSLRMRFNSNHDKNAWDAPAVEKFSSQGAMATAVLTFTFRGVPLIYNGDEAGNNKRLSLFEKVDIDWTKNPEFRKFYQQLTELRASHPALRRGAYVSLQNSDSLKVYSFGRTSGNDVVLTIINFSKESKRVTVAVPDSLGQTFVDGFDAKQWTTEHGKLSLQLAPLQFNIFAAKH